jgi:hypothetical protein
VCLSPVVIIFRLRSEEAHSAARLASVEGSRWYFPEAGLITQLVEQVEATDYYSLLATNIELVDGTIDIGESFESMQRHLILKIQKIPDDRIGRWARNRSHHMAR